MSSRPRRNHSATFKVKLAIEAVKGEKTIAEIVRKHDVHPNQVTEWRRQLLERATDMFDGGAGRATAEPAVDLKALHAKIGPLTPESDFLEGALAKAAPASSFHTRPDHGARRTCIGASASSRTARRMRVKWSWSCCSAQMAPGAWLDATRCGGSSWRSRACAVH
jgi:transposase